MEIKNLKLSGLIEISPKLLGDDRGYFFESYNEGAFKALGIRAHFVQDNQSYSKTGVLRGLHFQKNLWAQAKLVRVIRGRVLDVVVDLRRESPTYLQHEKVELSSVKNNMLWVPRGMAHGFVALEDSIFFYKCDNFYCKEAETGVRWDDPTLNIDWGIVDPIVSAKDQALPCLD